MESHDADQWGGSATLLLLRDASATSPSDTVILKGSSPVSYTATQNGEVITANSGVDTLNDGGFAVTLNAGSGTDFFIVHNLDTTVFDATGTGYDTVKTNLSSYTLPEHIQALTYTGSASFHGIGNDAGNIITGGSGDDTLDGGAGSDRLVGGAGNDTYYFDNHGDYAIEQSGGGYDTIYTTIGTKASPNVEALIYTGTAGVALYAADAGTSIQGGPGSDKVWGGPGNDTLDGDPKEILTFPGAAGLGENDTLFGGAGSDTFILHPSGYSVDRIIDFEPGTDHLKIVDPNVLPYGEFTTQAPQPIDDDGGHDIVAIYYYDQPHASLFFVDFLSGQVDSHLIATFDNRPTLSASDFVFG